VFLSYLWQTVYHGGWFSAFQVVCFLQGLLRDGQAFIASMAFKGQWLKDHGSWTVLYGGVMVLALFCFQVCLVKSGRRYIRMK